MLSFKTIKSKMIFGFAVVMAFIVILGSYVIHTFNESNKSVEQVLNKEIPLLIADEELAVVMVGRIAAARGFVMTGDQQYIDLFNEDTERSTAAREKAADIGTSDEFQQLMDKTVEWREYILNNVFEVYKRGDEELAVENLLSTNTAARELRFAYEEAAKKREAHIIELENELLKDGKTARTIVIVVIIAVILLSLATAVITANSISGPLRIVKDRMALIAGGDLSHEPLVPKSRDEIGQLVESTNEMNGEMHKLLNEIQHVSSTVSMQSAQLTQSAGEVKAGTAQIATTMEDLAHGTESQATNAGTLSSAMESFVMKVAEANDSGAQIQEASSSVLSMTNAGSEMMATSTKQMAVIDQIVQEAVAKVEGLDKHAQEISEIVSVIQDIAAQTNLLALNAAIEAARAGEHGKGFAVVADEVRNLAEQSSTSVTTITEIISRIQSESSVVTDSLQAGYKEVAQGTNQIETTGETFGKIASAVTEMVERIQTISENLNDISANSQEMSSSIQEIAAVTEQSAAGVEETSASSEQASSAMEEVANNAGELTNLAEELNRLLRQFTL